MFSRVFAMLAVFAFCATAFGATSQLAASEPAWSPVIVATGELRAQIRATPIEYRPYRPFHFYGNTVRRIYHRGTAVPFVR